MYIKPDVLTKCHTFLSNDSIKSPFYSYELEFFWCPVISWQTLAADERTSLKWNPGQLGWMLPQRALADCTGWPGFLMICLCLDNVTALSSLDCAGTSELSAFNVTICWVADMVFPPPLSDV